MSGEVLVLGGTGLLGRAVVGQLQLEKRPFRAPSRYQLDLASLGDARAAEAAIARFHAAAVINAVSFSDVTAAELPENHHRAFQLNRDLPERLAHACRHHGVAFVHLSTDYVFDGETSYPYTEDDYAAPLQVYGRSKHEGESAVLEALPSALIARTSTLFGPGVGGRPQYVEAILAQARSRRLLHVVEKPVSSPTYAPDLAATLLTLLDQGASGLVHVVNSGWCSRLDLARATVEAAGLAPRVEVHTRSAPADAVRRPDFCPLDTTRLTSLIGRPLRPWRDALTEFLGTMEKAAPESSRS